jgi:hypothetical protein
VGDDNVDGAGDAEGAAAEIGALPADGNEGSGSWANAT